MSVFDSGDFKDLKKYYYLLLKKEGFKDIENGDGGLISFHSQSYFSQRSQFKQDLMPEVRQYYIWAYQMACFGEFRDDRDRRIWELHAQGLSTREISALVKLHATWINEKIKKMRKLLRQ